MLFIFSFQMLERFSLAILRPSGRSVVPVDQRQKIKQITGHMADHYHTIFRLPSELLRDVQRELEELHARKISPHYCQRVSSDEYERQKNSTPTDHLQELLDSIAHDENVSAKIRKQRLKQVRDTLSMYIVHFNLHVHTVCMFNCCCVCVSFLYSLS